MRKLALIAAATIAATYATGALAAPPPTATPSNDPCHDVYVAGAIACQGYYTGNFFQGGAGDPTTADASNAIQLLLNGTLLPGDGMPTDSGPTYVPPYNLDYSTILAAIPTQTDGDNTFDFSPLDLTGLVIFGAHFGNNTDSTLQNVSAVWLLDLGSTHTSIVTLANGQGVSNAQIFATGPGGVPEPATWAMMLLGFGGIGVAMRRSRQKKALLTQIA
jgi:hypothetical protein